MKEIKGSTLPARVQKVKKVKRVQRVVAGVQPRSGWDRRSGSRIGIEDRGTASHCHTERQQRISVRLVSIANGSKYQSAGRLYSRRGLRLRRRGAYGIHRVFVPRCQGLRRCRSGGKGRGVAPSNSLKAPSWRGKIGTPFGGCATTFTQWEACHWIFGSLCSPASTLSPTHWILRSLPLPYESSSLVQLQFLCHPPVKFGGATKGKRPYGQARRLTSLDLHILCRMCTVPLWVLSIVPHDSEGKCREVLFSPP